MASIGWILLIRWWDHREPEPLDRLLRWGLWGIGTGIVLVLLRIGIYVVGVSEGILPPDPSRPESGIASIVIGGIISALVTYGIQLAVIHRRMTREHAFSQVVDGIVYAMIFGWGVVLVEHVTTLLGALGATTAGSTVAFHIIFSTLATGVSSGFLGLAVGKVMATENGSARGKRFTHLGIGLLEAVTLSAAFHTLLAYGQLKSAGVMVLVGALYLCSRFSVQHLTHAVTRRA